VWVLAAAVAGLCSRAGAQGTGGIAGRVTQQGGGGVSGAEVSVLFQVGSGVHMTVTDVTGAYTLGGLPAGAVFPRAAAPDDNLAAQWYGGAAFCGDQNQSKPCSARVTVVAGQTNRNINFTLPVGGMLVVTVRLSNATLPGGLYGSINVYDTNVNVVAFGMWTGGGPSPMGGSTDGVYRVGGLCPGSYYVNAMAPWSPPWNRYADEFYGDGSAWSGGWGDVPPNAVPVPVSAGQATTISITLDPMARIYGQVTSGAMPLDGQVMLFTEDSPCHPVPQGG
jgi:hypothetical protein